MQLRNEGSRKIGGEGSIVEIDETVFARRKYNRGRLVPEQWVVGGVCRGTDECFVAPVDRRDARTLRRVIRAHVADGSTIITDCWHGHRSEELVAAGFEHWTVNHSYHFVDPDTGAHTQTVERFWGLLKEQNKRNRGTPRELMPMYIAEFIWRYRNRATEDLFDELLWTIGLTYGAL